MQLWFIWCLVTFNAGSNKETHFADRMTDTQRGQGFASDGRVSAESGKLLGLSCLATAERMRRREFYLTSASSDWTPCCAQWNFLPLTLLPLAACLPSARALGASLISHPMQGTLQQGPCHLLVDCILSPCGKGPGQGHRASAVSHSPCVPGRSSRGGGDPTE